MTAMRQAVIVSRTREGARVEALVQGPQTSDGKSRAVHWIDTLYLATKGGAEALGLSTGTFTVGAPFDAQLSENLESGPNCCLRVLSASDSYRVVNLADEDGAGVGDLDFFDPLESLRWVEAIEKWWCLGNNSNRSGVWVQGSRVL